MSDTAVNKRQILNQDELVTRSSFNLRSRAVPDCCRSNYCSWRRCKRFVFKTFPCLNIFQEYNCKRDLYIDILTGLTIGFIQIPQSLAYAYLANVPPVCGLFTAFVSSILYFIFGSSRQANTGTFAIVCLLAGDIIISFNKHIEFNLENAQTMAAICVVTGVYQFIFYILQIGKLCTCLSETLINAFSVACACHITTSQIADILGIKLSQKSGHFRIYQSLMNIAGSFFCCVPTAVSLVRTMLCFNMNAASQLVGIFSCIIIIIVIFWGGYIFCLLPRCIIAAIIINCVIGTFKEFRLLKFYWKISKTDLVIWLITFIYVTFIDIVIGFGVGIGISILIICYQSFRTDSCLLGTIPNTELYLDLRKYKQVQEIPEIKIFRYVGGINFATRQLFRNGLAKATGVNAKHVVIERTKAQRKLKPGQTLPDIVNDFKIIVLDFSGITNIDYQGIEHFKSVVDVYKKIGIIMLMANPHGNVYDTFLHIKNVCHYDDQYPFFPTIHDAVLYAQSLLNNKKSSTR